MTAGAGAGPADRLSRAAFPPAEGAAPPRRGGTATSGARLAAATGTQVSYEENGVETVTFPRPAGASFAPAVALMRAHDGSDHGDNQGGEQSEGATPATAPTQAAAPAAAAPPAPQPGGGAGGGGDIEEIYDQVMQRLRRDLLADRERMGDVLGDLP